MRRVLLLVTVTWAALLLAGVLCAQGAEPALPEGFAVCQAFGNKAPGEAGFRIVHQETGLELVWVPGGKFKLGAEHSRPDEAPMCEVEMPGHWIGRTEVTVAQWRKVMGKVIYSETNSEGDDHPMVMVKWDDCKAFCEKLGLRLPSELEWEYTARGPENRVYPWGKEWNADLLVWPATRWRFNDSRTAPVGSFPKGVSWCGAFDLAGNVAEWCADWYRINVYQGYKTGDLSPPKYGTRRVVRGGSWEAGNPRVFRGYSRSFRAPEDRSNRVGFRVARSA